MSSPRSLLLLLSCFAAVLGFGRVCSASGNNIFGYDIHHRFSDPIKALFGDVGEVPEKGSAKYYRAMAHRDRLRHGRQLATSDGSLPPLTFFNGNVTNLLQSLAFLHYANVTVGTPSSWYLVALDTGSDLFWLPCECTTCLKSLRTTSGKTIPLNIYSPNVSTTSSNVPCSSNMCEQPSLGCPLSNSTCPYQIRYLSNNTSSTGTLVEDVLHLITNDEQSNPVDARITLGCGRVQTGDFIDNGAPNGLFGLGLDKVSVPSMLAKQGLSVDSFSMCFGEDGVGRISFGDNGTTDQLQTPINLDPTFPTYNVTVTQVSIGGNARNLKFNAVFDTGTSFSFLNDPVYTYVGTTYDTLADEPRYVTNSNIPFEYCYKVSPTQKSISIPVLNLTMQGGDRLDVISPVEILQLEDDTIVWCVGMIKSDSIHIIGQNFMMGYRVIFDREKLILGWKPYDCYSLDNSTIDLHKNSSAVPPAVPLDPRSNNTAPDTNSPTLQTPVPPFGSGSRRFAFSIFCTLFVIVFSFVVLV